MGDADGYHSVETFDEIFDVLREVNVGENITRCPAGIDSRRYRGDNYISLYWGDDFGNFSEEISDQELEKIQNTFNEEE